VGCAGVLFMCSRGEVGRGGRQQAIERTSAEGNVCTLAWRALHSWVVLVADGDDTREMREVFAGSQGLQ
jgi:hypothetical protein